MLYLYLASNKDNYNLALSPAAITAAIGMPRSTYHDQFQKLINKGYLVDKGKNHYEFYELPQPRAVTPQNSLSDNGLNFDADTSLDKPISNVDIKTPQGDTEINNSENQTNNKNINNNEYSWKEKYIF